MRRLCCTLLGIAGATFAVALPPFLETFKEVYGPLKGQLANAQCGICHTQPPRRHAFGRAVRSELAKQQVRQVSATVLQAIEAADADGDGWPNGDEISQGFLPGDPNNHPDGEPPMPVAPVSMQDPAPVGHDAAPKSGAGPIPSHAFHPLVVHFPIALFLFGVFLDVLGARRGDEGLRRLALWNLEFGAIGSVIALSTGLTSFLMKGLAFEGLPMWHMLLGILACVCMVGSALMKRRDPLAAGAKYWALVGVGVVATTIGGHLGATIVFG